MQYYFIIFSIAIHFHSDCISNSVILISHASSTSVLVCDGLVVSDVSDVVVDVDARVEGEVVSAVVVVAEVVIEIVVPSSTFMVDAEVVVSVFSVSTGTSLMVGDFRLFFLYSLIYSSLLHLVHTHYSR